MKKKVIVLGAGLVGSSIAKDLSKNHQVTSVDFDPKAFTKFSDLPEINCIQEDLSQPEKIKSLVADYDLVIGAVPGFMGYQTMKAVIEAGKNMVDISFMPEDFLSLNGLAQKNKVCIVADCGVAPGMGNIILGHYNEKMSVKSYECLVGGLPVIREWPYEYKAVFSPIDVIEEYTRPARYIQNYELVEKEALSDPELIDFEGVGTLESWNSDGLRSLMQTMKNIPDMIEKTLRYPGCIEYLRVLRASGFFSYDPVEVNGVQVRPIDVTAKLLFPKWQLKPGEEDFTIMRIVIKGIENGTEKSFTYHLLDKYDRETQTISMARTTGYTCSSVANLVLDGVFNSVGVSAPEAVGAQPGNLSYIFQYMKERGVIYTLSE
ncbi:saccharopine dehydrogenase C-terminal domain-containing protein [Draconibacterium sp. IB214405]|uniref:saccharopine dehydrogenase family protein n=1 Tax=Draconibacterium sp. IB214405 TaxID=3097352 RepID=UPI002A138589|nr:saccharopine dehydrogenase C-terminal domain-containing protein [Draconibacterium sp. IB214405]MDX8340718.1 saccharopine dehydrogenase C-terminal domain-containing protein [Draconibacterium sp. IB214405]